MAVTPVLTTQFQIASPYSASLFLFEDTTDYAGLGIALTDVNGAITVIRPDGVTWHAGSHSPADIDPNVSTENNVIAVPLDVNGDPIEGTYTIIYEIVVIGATEPGTWSSTYAVDFCLCDSDAPPTPLISWDISCIAAPVITVTDSTSYGLWTVNSRSITAFAPANANPPYNTSYTSAGMSANSGNNAVWAGLWTARLVSEIERDFGTHTVTYTLTSNPGNVSIPSASKEVVCEPFCNIRCCVNEAYQRWQTATTTQSIALYKEQWNQAVTLLFQAWFESEQCASSANTDAYIQQIKTILSCNDDCGDCSGDRQGIITPISGASTTYTFVNGTPTWTIVTEVGGVVTIGLTAAGANTLSGARNYALGLDGDLTAAGFSIVGPVTTPGTPPLNSATLSFTGEFPRAIQKVTGRINIAFTGIGSLLTEIDTVVTGTVFQAPGTVTAVGLADLAWAVLPAILNIGDFYATPPAPGDPVSYKMIGTMQVVDYRGLSVYTTASSHRIEFIGPNTNNSSYAIIVDNATGLPVTWGALNGVYRAIDIAYTLQD